MLSVPWSLSLSSHLFFNHWSVITPLSSFHTLLSPGVGFSSYPKPPLSLVHLWWKYRYRYSLYEIKIYVYAFIAYSSAPILRCDNLIHYLALMHRFNDTYFLWGPGSYHLVVVHRPLFNNIRFLLLLYNLNFTFYCQYMYSFILYISSYSFPHLYTCHSYCNQILFLICTLIVVVE